MIYELFIKLTGGALLSLIHFLPLSLEYDKHTLAIHIELTEPVTNECLAVVNQGLHFGIHYQMLMIINESKSYLRDTTITISEGNGYSINGAVVPDENIQTRMGTLTFRFDNSGLKDADRLEILVKANLVRDEEFKKSTGFETAVLWKYYVPRIKTVYRFAGSHFIPLVDK